jgi:two-component system sensor histidine kinase QseC
MRSIRSRLLAWLLILFTVIWLVVTLATYLESRHEVEELFDAQLAQSAAVLAEIGLSSLEAGGSNLERAVYGHPYGKKIAFQIWSGSRLLLRSTNAPVEPLAEVPGYSDRRLAGDTWRVFSLVLDDEPRHIYVGERYDVRDELILLVTLNALYPLSLALPALTLLIWLGIGRGLAPLSRIADEVAARSPDNLEPVAGSAGAPQEVQPLIAALDDLFARLESAFERERRFTSDAAHELRTPLASLKVQAQVALRAREEPQRRHALQQIIEGVDRTTRLVAQLLTLARLEPEAAAAALTRVDLQDLAGAVVEELSAASRRKGITVRLSTTLPRITLGHPTALRVLIRNLVENAILYSPEGSQVEVAVEQGADRLELSVSDSGPGIAAEDLALVFNRFYRGTSQSGVVGSGLGLSIVRRIAEIHGAEVRLDSPPTGQGLRVRVEFPSPTGGAVAAISG